MRAGVLTSACTALPALAAGRRKATWQAGGQTVKRRKVRGSWLPAPQELELTSRIAAPGTTRASAAAQDNRAPPSSNSITDGPVKVAFCVSQCYLQPGDHLRVVGSCAELGRWEVAAAPALTWQDVDGGRWAAKLRLAPGTHEFKLVIAREDGSVQWEEGANRTLTVPPLVGLGSMSSPPLAASCCWGDTSATLLSADLDQLQAALDAAAARVSELQEERQQLGHQVSHLEQEVHRSDAAIASKRREVEQLVAAEHQRLAQLAELAAAATLVPSTAADAALAIAAASAADVAQLDAPVAAEGRASVPVPPGPMAVDAESTAAAPEQAKTAVEAPATTAGNGEGGSVPERATRVSHLVTSSVFDEEMIDETAERELMHLQHQQGSSSPGAETSQRQPSAQLQQQEQQELSRTGSADEQQLQAEAAQSRTVEEKPDKQVQPPVVGVEGARSERQEDQEEEMRGAEEPAAPATMETAPASASEEPAAAVEGASGIRAEAPATAATAASHQSAALAPAEEPSKAAAAADAGAAAPQISPVIAMEEAVVEACPDGSLSFNFAAAARSSGSSGDEKAGTSAALPTAHELAKQRLMSRLPPQAAEGLERQLRCMSNGSAGNRGVGGSTPGVRNSAQQPRPPTPTGQEAEPEAEQAGDLSADFARLLMVEEPEQASQHEHQEKVAPQRSSPLSPSVRGSDAVGGPAQPAAASAGEDLPDQRRRRSQQPKAPKQPRQLRAGDVSLPRMADEPPSAEESSAGEGEAPPTMPSPVGSIGRSPATTAQQQQPLQQGQRQEEQQRQQQQERAEEVLRLFSTPKVVPSPGGAPRSFADGYNNVTMRASLPIAAAWLVLSSVYGAGDALWAVGRTGLPPAARRPADVAFWLLFTAAVVAPFWK